MKLKPCPFCGSKEVSVGIMFSTFYTPECLSCTVEGSTSLTEQQAIEAWNRRVTNER